MMKRARDDRGFAIFEYLVIIVVIIAAIVAIRASFGTNVNSLFGSAANLTSNAATTLSAVNLE
jgi:Flp pilus assembly pilin Flp